MDIVIWEFLRRDTIIDEVTQTKKLILNDIWQYSMHVIHAFVNND